MNEIFEFGKEYVDYIIFAILGFMSFLVVLFSVERVIYFMRVKKADFKSKVAFERALTKNMTTLYIIYQNAPYIGLLGTVCGIMITFYDMSKSTNIDALVVVYGLSLALKATALGIFVAIPTLMIYNAFGRKIQVLLSEYDDDAKL